MPCWITISATPCLIEWVPFEPRRHTPQLSAVAAVQAIQVITDVTLRA